MKKVNYKETSKLFNPFFMITLAPTFILISALLINAIVEYSKVDIAILSFFLVINICLLFLLLIHKLELSILSDSLMIKYPPYYFKEKSLLKSDIKHIKIVEYNPMRDFGGWGFKKSKLFGQGLTTKGSIGLHIILKNNSSFLISIFNKSEIQKALNL